MLLLRIVSTFVIMTLSRLIMSADQSDSESDYVDVISRPIDYFRLDLGSDSPDIPPTITRGMIIDAGSGGSRLHVYRWFPRVFTTVPPPLSFPTSDERWTGRIGPGIASYYNNISSIDDHLMPLIDFAKSVLSGLENDYKYFPIFFKATGGMRELNEVDRENVLFKVRTLLSDKTFNPFYFRNDFARVISGEEEAIYSWCAANLLMGSLLSSSKGSGTVVSPVNSTYGTLDLGGSSTQIAFFQPQQDIMEGLFKLQIGAQKHWNVYAKSFLGFGINSARRRHVKLLVNNIVTTNGLNFLNSKGTENNGILNECFHSGYHESVYSDTYKVNVNVYGPSVVSTNQLTKCMSSLKPLLYLSNSSNSYCTEMYYGQCSLAGSYSPPLPSGKHGHFIGTSSYTMPWKFLMLPSTSSLDAYREKANFICSLNYDQVLNYYQVNSVRFDEGEKLGDSVQYFCFLASYTLLLLEDGYGFKSNQTLTVFDEINGNKMAWPLGAILYEINALPWGVKHQKEKQPWSIIFLSCSIGIIVGAIISYFIAKELFSNPINNFEYNGIGNIELPEAGHSLPKPIIKNGYFDNTLSPELANKKWVKDILQFNPFHSPKNTSINETTRLNDSV